MFDRWDYKGKYEYWWDADLHKLVGKTIISIEGLEAGSEEVHFTFSDGSEFFMIHQPDCCESVSIEDVNGVPSSLLNQPLIKAEEVSGDMPEHEYDEYNCESQTWTFIHFATVNGYVTVRWYGVSNGYYGEVPVYYYIPAKQEQKV